MGFTRYLNSERIAREQPVEQHGAEKASEERSYPINAVVDPMMRCQGGSKRPRRVQGSAGERLAEKHPRRNGETHSRSSELPKASLGIEGRCKVHQYNEESRHAFEQHPVHAGEIRGEVGRAERNGAPGSLRQNRDEQVPGSGSARQLRDALEKRRKRAQPLRDPGTDRDSRVQMRP